MSRVLVVWLTLVVLLAGCGQVADDGVADGKSEPAAAASTERDEPAEEPTDDDTEEGGSFGFGGVIFAEGDFARSGKRPEFRDVYAVFARAPNDRDARAFSHAAERFNEPYDRHHDRLGRVLAPEARVLLEELGGEQDILYAVPTDNGYICVGLAPNGGSHCGGAGSDGLSLAYSYNPTNSLLVYGMVGNDVTGVEVIVSARTHMARMGENGFAARIKNATPYALHSVVLHYRDRQSETIELP